MENLQNFKQHQICHRRFEAERLRLTVSLRLYLINRHTGAVAPAGCKCKARLADALKAAVLVDAHAVQTHVGGGTFVVI